jgi:HK97 family phage major capsid protein
MRTPPVIGVRADGRPIFLIAGGDGTGEPTQTQDQQPQTTQGQNMYRTLQEIDGRQAAIRTELQTIDVLPEPTDEDVNWQGTLIQEYDQLEDRARPLRRRMADIDRVLRARQDPDNREDGAPRSGGNGGGRQAPDVYVRSGRDPFEELDKVRRGLVGSSDLRVRAQLAIETDAKRYALADASYAETATRRAESSPRIAKHILLTGSPEYRDAFAEYLRDPENLSRERSMTLTAASGGYLLPYVLDPTIVLTNNASANPFRRISRNEQTTSNAWQGVSSAGVTAAWITETTTAADMSPTIGQIQITPTKAAAWVFGSYEALDDTNFGEQLPGLLADARDRLESAAFATGSGTNQPLGVVAALGTGSRVAPTATGTAFNGTASIPDVYNLQAALPPRFRNSRNVGWIANIIAINKVRALDQYGGSAFWANFGSDTPEQLLGKSIYEASDMNATMTGASGATGTGSVTLLFGDWQQFIVVDRVGVSMLYEPLIKGASNAQLPTGQAGWYMFWRTGSSVSTTAAFRYLTIS